jgi:hypothetical protein
MKNRVALVLIAALAATSGCAAEAPPAPALYTGPYDVGQEDMSAQQRAAIKDDIVTYDEYESAYGLYAQCLSNGGYELIDDGMVDRVHQYFVPTAAETAGVEPGCYISEFAVVDTTWQVVGSKQD